MTAYSLPWTAVDAEFERIVDELSRRGFLAGGLGSAALLGLTACGSPESSGSGVSASSTRRLDDAYGTVTLPASPKRVVALGKAAVATLLDVGLTPIGVDEGEADVAIPQYRKRVATIPTVGTYGQFDVEKIAALRPDLVISFDTYLDRSLYPKLAAIAPTYAVKTNQGSIAWPTATAAFAAAVNRNAQLRALRDTYAATLADLARTEADVLRGNTWEVTQAANAGTFYRYLANSDGSAILHQLGARLGETATAAEYWGPELSYERIDDQLGRASVILCVEVGSAPLLGQPLWQRLPAARAGHVYTSDLIFPASYSGAIALLDFIRTVCTELRAPSS